MSDLGFKEQNHVRPHGCHSLLIFSAAMKQEGGQSFEALCLKSWVESCSTLVEGLTHNPKVDGSTPAPGTGKDIKWQKSCVY